MVRVRAGRRGGPAGLTGPLAKGAGILSFPVSIPMGKRHFLFYDVLLPIACILLIGKLLALRFDGPIFHRLDTLRAFGLGYWFSRSGFRISLWNASPYLFALIPAIGWAAWIRLNFEIDHARGTFRLDRPIYRGCASGLRWVRREILPRFRKTGGIDLPAGHGIAGLPIRDPAIVGASRLAPDPKAAAGSRAVPGPIAASPWTPGTDPTVDASPRAPRETIGIASPSGMRDPKVIAPPSGMREPTLPGIPRSSPDPIIIAPARSQDPATRLTLDPAVRPESPRLTSAPAPGLGPTESSPPAPYPNPQSGIAHPARPASPSPLEEFAARLESARSARASAPDAAGRTGNANPESIRIDTGKIDAALSEAARAEAIRTGLSRTGIRADAPESDVRIEAGIKSGMSAGKAPAADAPDDLMPPVPGTPGSDSAPPIAPGPAYPRRAR